MLFCNPLQVPEPVTLHMQAIRDQAVRFWGYADPAVVAADLKPPAITETDGGSGGAAGFTSEVYEQLLSNPKLSAAQRQNLERLYAARVAKEEAKLAGDGDGAEGLARLNSFLSKTTSRVDMSKVCRRPC